MNPLKYPKKQMKLAVLTWIFFIPFFVNAQYTQVVEAPSNSPAVNYIYVGALTMDPSNTSNYQKLKVSVIGNTWFSNSIGETTYYIANRGGLTVNQTVTGGSGLATSVLQCYQNGTTYSFYLNIPSSAGYSAYMVSAFLLINGNSTANTQAQSITIAPQTATPAGTNVTSSITFVPVMITDAAGNIAIGAPSSDNYKLAVNGSFIATSATVKVYKYWPDFVFQPNYNLRSLSDLDKYVQQYHHLPDMPSAKEVIKNGLDLGETDKLLTKKIEELTLYLIDKDKQIKDGLQKQAEQDKKLAEQQTQIDKLTRTVEQLSKKLNSGL